MSKSGIDTRSGIEEALEQQVVLQRVEVGDAERIGDQRPGARAAPRADRHAVLLRPVDEVGDDQEVAREAHLDDRLQLEFQALDVVQAALLQPGMRLLPQVVVDRQLPRRREVGQPALAKRHLQAAAARDLDRVLQRLRDVGEEPGHLRLALEILLWREMLRPALVGEHVALRDAHSRLVRPEVVAVEELHRVGGDHRQLEPRGERHRARHQRVGVRMTRALQLEVVASGKSGGPALRLAFRRFGVIGEQRLPDVAGGPARERDQALAALFQPLAAQLAAAAVLVLEPRPGQQLTEAQVACVRGAEEEDPVGLLAVGIVLQPAVGTHDRLYAPGARRAVEFDHPEEVGRVGEGKGRHPVLRRPAHGILQPDDAVIHRVLTVHPQMNENRLPHVEKFYRERMRMSRILTLLLTLFASAVFAQAQPPLDRSAALDKAVEEARAAQLALQATEAKREQAVEPQLGERTGNAGGGARLNENYMARQALLDQEVAQARKRYEDAMKRWNDLK
jgi:hypothetical protein